MKREFKNRYHALRFANKVSGKTSWYQTMGTIKKKDKFTGNTICEPALITMYRVTY